MYNRMELVTLLLLTLTCWIKQSKSAATQTETCTLEITSHPNNGHLTGHLNCMMCDVMLTSNQRCPSIFTSVNMDMDGDLECKGCNTTFQLCNRSTIMREPRTTTIEGQTKLSMTTSTTVGKPTTENPMDDDETLDDMQQKSVRDTTTVTVCPTRSIALAETRKCPKTCNQVSPTTSMASANQHYPCYRKDAHMVTTSTMGAGSIMTCNKTMVTTLTVFTTVAAYYCNKTNPTETANSLSETSSLKAALGVLTGLFMLILAVVSSGYIFIYWSIKKREQKSRRAQTGEFPKLQNTTNTIGPDKTLKRFSNPIYEDLEQEEFITVEGGLLTPERQEAGPTYEVIPVPDTINNGGLVKSGGMHRKGNSNKRQGASNGKSVVVDVHDDKHHGKTCKDELEDTDTENNYHLLGEDIYCKKRKQKITEENALNIEEDNYFLLSSADGDDTTEQTRKQEKRENDEEDFYTLLDNEGEVSEANKEVSDEEDNYALLGNTEEVSEEEKKQEKRESIKEDDYALLSNIEVTHEDTRVKSVYHVLEVPADDNDYEDPDEGNLLQESFQLREEKSQLNDDYEVPCTAFLNIDKTDRR